MQRVANPLSKSMDYDLVRITMQRVASPLSKTMAEIVHEEMPPPSAHSLELTLLKALDHSFNLLKIANYSSTSSNKVSSHPFNLK